MAALVLSSVAGTALAAEQDPPVTVDTHVDIPADYMRQDRYDVGHDSKLQVDLGKMRRGGLDAPFFIVYVGQGPLTEVGYAKAVAQAERKYEGIGRMLLRYPDRIRLATTPEQVLANKRAGLLSAMIGIENAYSLGHDLHRLDAAYDRGARYVGLVHIGNNDLCTSSMPDVEHGEAPMNSSGDTGMSAFGRRVVERANQLGMMVDVSHASDQCTRDALKFSSAPVIASHSSARAVADVPRNLPDDLIKAIAAKGGVIQAVALGSYVKKTSPARAEALRKAVAEVAKARGFDKFDYARDAHSKQMQAAMARVDAQYPPATLDDFVDHIEHIVKIAGIDHVGIASDFDGGGGIVGWKDASQTRNVTAALRKRGFSADDIAKIWGGNLLRVWGQVQAHAQTASSAP